MDWEVFETNGTYPFSFGTQIFRTGIQVIVPTSTWPVGTLGSVVSFLAATLCQGNPDRNHNLWNIGSPERYIMQLTDGTYGWDVLFTNNKGRG